MVVDASVIAPAIMHARETNVFCIISEKMHEFVILMYKHFMEICQNVEKNI